MIEHGEEIPSSSAKDVGEEINALTKGIGGVVNDDNKDDGANGKSTAPNNSLPWWKFGGDEMSQGYTLMLLARAPLLYSGVFLSTTIFWLASDEAGCVDENEELLEDCDGRVYGYKPESFISMILIISGLLSAFFMPIIGAMVDCTDHRKTLAIATAIMLVVITCAQAALNSSTWLVFTFVQGICIFIFEAQAVTLFAYQPDLVRILGEKRHTSYNATFVACSMIGMLLYLIICGIATRAFDLKYDGGISRFAHAFAAAWALLCYFFCFRSLPKAPKKREIQEGRSLIAEGFCNVYRTVKEINTKYKHGLRWFFIATALGDAGIKGYFLGSIVYLQSVGIVDESNVGFLFPIIILSGIVGALTVKTVMKRLKPIPSWQLCMVLLSLSTFAFVPLMEYVYKYLAFIWLVIVGFFVGWYHVLQIIFLANAVPKDKEAEMSGFFVYCTLILTWLPGVIIGVIFEAGVQELYAVIAITGFFVLSAFTLAFTGTWDQILKEGREAGEDSSCQND